MAGQELDHGLDNALVEGQREGRLQAHVLREESEGRGFRGAGQGVGEEVFALVTEEVARHLDVDVAMTVRYDGPGLATIVARTSPPVSRNVQVGAQIVLVPETSIARAGDGRARADRFL